MIRTIQLFSVSVVFVIIDCFFLMAAEEKIEAAAAANVSVSSSEVICWYYGEVGGSRGGPVSWVELSKMCSNETLVWTAGMTNWESFESVKLAQTQNEDDSNEKDSQNAGAKDPELPVKRKRNRKKRKPKPGPNSSVYVSNLPEDISVDELLAHFRTVGIIKQDIDTDEHKIRIYQNEEGLCKGDALVTYMQPLSADTAVSVLDESQIRPSITIRVEKAKFDDLPTSHDPKKLKLSAAQLSVQRRLRRQKMQELLSWDEEPATAGLRIVILKNMFHPSEADDDPTFYEDLERDIGLECQKDEVGGPIEKITVFKKSPLGAVAIKFAKSIGAEKCIETQDGRWFGGRRIECEFFDGVTNYKVKETEEEEQARIKQFGDWLENQ